MTTPEEIERLKAENDRLRDELNQMVSHYDTVITDNQRLEGEVTHFRSALENVQAKCEAIEAGIPDTYDEFYQKYRVYPPCEPQEYDNWTRADIAASLVAVLQCEREALDYALLDIEKWKEAAEGAEKERDRLREENEQLKFSGKPSVWPVRLEEQVNVAADGGQQMNVQKKGKKGKQIK
jgi:FtsZ-binding cell division protein ZapB